jgi:cell division protein FtsB
MTLSGSMSPRRILGLVLAAVVLSGLLFLFVLPGRTYLSQRANLSAATSRLKVLGAESAKLEARIKQLQTDAEIERLARQRYGLVKPGEQAYAILPPQQAAPPPTSPKKRSHHAWWEFWR